MKLVITIPAFNEEKTLAAVLDEIPKKIKGIDIIQVLVINDGSQDQTESIAKSKGALVFSHKTNQGLAKTFQDGLDIALLELGADIIVNTDADFQYNQQQIPLLVQPILEEKADLVLGSRFSGWIEDMPRSKKIGNQLATKAVSIVSGIPITDGQTGFRAFSREAALHLQVMSRYTYTQETILQAAQARLKIFEIPIDFRKRNDQSRLISSIWSYARRSATVLLMGYLTYRPLRVFVTIGGLLAAIGMAGSLFILNHFVSTGQVTPHIPLAIASVAFILFGGQIILLGLVAEMIKQSRVIQAELLYRQKKALLEERFPIQPRVLSNKKNAK